ncbi:nuclear-pore anchor-like isoform X2 [Magnolia sinica]|uniref:nuclear-pore anchor-like isoform X2 n=1 Tax=Magnolia sinica TaxID=86752 RepID=UPI0026585063|nr:nuclear-pore anchor-like isoform X2 [Magnolia sinica]
MPLFLSDEEFQRCADDVSVVAEKADAYIRELQRQLETVRAQADASAITAEQACALLDQKYISLSSDYAKIESQNAQLSSALEQRLSELAESQSQKHQLHLKAIEKDGEVERLSVQASEVQKSKRQLLELLEQKDLEIGEKNATIQSYLDKILTLTDAAALKEAKLHDSAAELARSRSACTRLSQEKELIERHNIWLNEELTTKVNSLIELRRSHTEFEAEMSSKLADVEKQLDECSVSLKGNKERVRELEMKLTSTQEELCSSKAAAAENEARFSEELSTVNKLVELYKESAEEWSRKAGELEGVIKALEKHLSQVENDYKEKLEKEASTRKDFEKVGADLKEKLEKCEIEIENARKANELSLLPISSLQSDSSADEILIGGAETADRNEDGLMLVPNIPAGVSGTALAASLLRNGWSLAKMYGKYQEAVDALRHEQLERKHSQAILERVLYEIQEKAEVILDERAEHERMVEAYNLMNQKLQQSLSEHANFENTIRELKAMLRRQERDYDVAHKEILDLQKQVTVLLKECQDTQFRCGAGNQVFPDDFPAAHVVEVDDETEADKVISDRLLTFKDIEGLVEQNVQLRSLVRSLSNQNDQRDVELRESFEMELQKRTDEASSKVAAVLKRSEEQGRMIESLHSSVAMYKRLYEEELKTRASCHNSVEANTEDGRKNLMLLFEDSQAATKKALEQAVERARSLEEDLAKSRSEAISLRLERDKIAMEANFARERLDSFKMELEHQKNESNGILARNVEFSQLIVNYQRRLRESADSLNSSEERSRKLSMEVSVLKHERDILINSEKRASEEVRSLSERVHRLQATLGTIQSAEEVREDARAMERRKHDEYLKQVEREWAEAKKALQEERDHVRTLTLGKEEILKDAMRQVEELGKELADALRAVAAAEARALTAEARCFDLEAKLKCSEKMIVGEDGGSDHSIRFANELIEDMQKAKEEMEKLKGEAQANKDHMLQYKEIAQVNEVALKQIESAHEKFKAEADKLKKSLEDEIHFLKGRVSELESDLVSKSTEVTSAVSGKEEALSSAFAEIDHLKEENSVKTSQIVELEIQISSLKEDLEKEHLRWRTSQSNYERQVILQSETIQELTKTSQALALLQDEASKLRKLVDTQKSENDILKETWAEEKSVLQKLKDEAERKYSEINEQNKMLHSRLEAMHIKSAEKERNSVGISSSTYADSHGDDDLQNVINYLRRSKEIAETEISLLKQEKLRLQSQLESALKASEAAQASLHAERTNSRAVLFTDEEFKSLKLQVTEMNLLRESNMQLREENKHNFEECQKFREIAQKAKVETEHLSSLLRETQIELDVCRKEIERKKIELEQLEQRISESLERSKNVDLEEYNCMKENFQQIQLKLREKEAEVEEAKKLVSEAQERIFLLEQNLANCQSELNDMQKKNSDYHQANGNLKLEAERQKKLASHLKKKIDMLTKEKDELSKEKQALTKQIEESKSSKMQSVETASEQAMREKEKEKDTRIQMLEKILEREREELRKEKSRRQKTQNTVESSMKIVQQEKKKVYEELERHKLARDNLLETSGISGSQLPLETGLDDQTAAYFQAVDNFEEAVRSAPDHGIGAHAIPIELSSLVDTSHAATGSGQQLPAQPVVVKPPSLDPTASPQVKVTEEAEKIANAPKPSIEARRPGRKLVRPRLERPQEPPNDIESSEMQGSSTATDAKGGPSHNDPEPQGVVSLPPLQAARKRLASSSASELGIESLGQQEACSDVAPLMKKPKGSCSPQDGNEEPTHPPENLELPPIVEEMRDAVDDPVHGSNDEAVDAAKDEEMDTVKELAEEPNEPVLQNASDATVEELSEKPRETAEMFDGRLQVSEANDDPQQSTGEAESEREEGELVPDGAQPQDSADVVGVMDIEPDDSLGEPGDAAADIDNDGAIVDMGDPAVEIVSPSEALENEDKKEGSELLEDVAAEGSDKSGNNNGNDQGSVDSQQSPEAALRAAGEGSPSVIADSDISKQGSTSTMPETAVGEGKESQGSRSNTTIDLRERARQRSQLRQAGVVSPPYGRGRGRAVSSPMNEGGRRGRGRRGGRGGGRI